jgi:tetratricopeptide (TPR) repeat protein
MKQFSILFFMLFIVLGSKAQKVSSVPEGFQLSSFMVRSSFYTNDLAKRFLISPSIIKKFNPKIKSVIYKGSVIRVPIKVRPTQWDPSKVNTNKLFLGPEDARPIEEWEWEKETIDPLLSEEVLSLNEINGDSIQKFKISQHIKKIDQRVSYLKFQTDSIKREEFSFEYDEKDINALLKRLQQARNRHYESSPFGREQDSLNKLRSLLSEENNRLSLKLNEYEYLVDNAYYFKKSKEGARDLKSAKKATSIEYRLYYERQYLIDNDGELFKKKETKSTVKPTEIVTYEKSKVSVDKKSVSKPKETLISEENKVIASFGNEVNDSKSDIAPSVTNLQKSKSEAVIPLKDNVSTEKDMVDLSELPFTSLTVIKTNDNTNTLFYSKKIVKEQQLNLDDVDNLILNEKLVIPQFSIKPIKVDYIKGKPFYSIGGDSISKMKSMGFLNLFKANILLNEQKQAIENLEKSIKVDPQNVKSWVYHADLLLLSQRQQDAMIEYLIATKIDPNNSALFFKIGSLYEKTNNIGKAYEFYSNAISVDSFYSNAYFARAKLSLEQGEIKEAIRDYSDLLQILPTIENAYKERGHLRLKERDYEGALWDYNEYFKIANPDADVYYRRGICKLFTGKIVDGCEDFKVAKKLNFYDAEKALKKYCE